MTKHDYTPRILWDDSTVCDICGAEYGLHVEWQQAN